LHDFGSKKNDFSTIEIEAGKIYWEPIPELLDQDLQDLPQQPREVPFDITLHRFILGSHDDMLYLNRVYSNSLPGSLGICPQQQTRKQ
jgi:hypothetical protein